jgi:hypothetical protein
LFALFVTQASIPVKVVTPATTSEAPDAEISFEERKAISWKKNNTQSEGQTDEGEYSKVSDPIV